MRRVCEQPDEVDYGLWTPEEVDLLAAEAVDLVAGDGFDEPDDSKLRSATSGRTIRH